ncbi:MAG: dihydrolipoyl dehydrogenase [Proteobacteria bacterium]|nr:dihydrolipoyl dehydrogenase [Pseudomonadota bacterium]
MANNYDLIIIGGGPGGYVAAIRAAQLKMKVAVVEREHLGGICLNWGCIPTKALLRTAEVRHLIRNAADFGLKAKDQGFDLKAVVGRSRKIAKQLTSGVEFLMKKNHIEVIAGEGALTAPTKVSVRKKDGKTSEITARNIILATGARARETGSLKADGKNIWTYKHALVPSVIPKSLLVIGSGAIGMEFASFFNDMESKVHVVEVLERILPQEDHEVSAFAKGIFKKHGMTIETGTTVESLKAGAKNVTVTFKGGKSATYDKVILAIGITGNVENLGLEAAGVKVAGGHVVTGQWGATGVPGLWAIGDLTGPPWLAHKAMHEGVIVVEKIAGLKNLHALDKSNIPGCTYCRPQVASVGLTEAAAKEAGYEVRIGKFPFIANGKAIALGDTEGFVKTVFDVKSGELLGAHMIGPEVTELIQGYAIAKTLESTEAELMAAVFPHPTLSEAMHESVLSAYGKALHI